MVSITPHQSDRHRILDRAERIADRCRSAGLAFVHGAGGWGKAELARWLVGPYRLAVSAEVGFAPEHEAAPRSTRAVERESLEDVLRHARWSVVSALESAALPSGRPEFVTSVVEHHYVVPRAGADCVAWVPLDGHRMHLRSRVLALFAVDYLVRPESWQTELFACHLCDDVFFDAAAKRRGYCHDCAARRRLGS